LIFSMQSPKAKQDIVKSPIQNSEKLPWKSCQIASCRRASNIQTGSSEDILRAQTPLRERAIQILTCQENLSIQKSQNCPQEILDDVYRAPSDERSCYTSKNEVWKHTN
jgi:hypothetical protein